MLEEFLFIDPHDVHLLIGLRFFLKLNLDMDSKLSFCNLILALGFRPLS